MTLDLRRTFTPFLPLLLPVTVVAVLVEFFLLRLLPQGGAFAPQGEVIDLVFEILTAVGLVGLSVAVVTSALALLVIAILVWRPGPLRALTVLILLVLALAALFFLLRESILLLLYPLVAMTMLALLLLLHPRIHSWDFAGAAAAAVSIATTLYALAATNAALIDWDLEYSQQVFNAGEIFVVATPILFVFGRRWSPWAAAAGIAAGLAFYVVSMSPYVPLLEAWTIYVAYFLPTPVYAIAFGALVYCMWNMLTDASQRWMGYGLLMVVLAGRAFENTYLAQLSLLGAVLLILPLAMIVDIYPEWADGSQGQHSNLQ